MSRIFEIRSAVVAVLLAGLFLTGASVQGDTARLDGVACQRNADGSASFVISKSGSMDVREFRMDAPPRLVVDFVGAEQGIADPVVEGDGVFVERVRTSQFANAPDLVARVVFDLKGDSSYRLRTDEGSVTVEFFSESKARPDEPSRSPMQGSLGAPSLGTTVSAGKAAETRTPAAVASQSAAAESRATAQPVADASAEETPARLSWDTTPEREGFEYDAPVSTPQRPILVPQAPTLQAFSAGAGLVSNRNITIDVQEADIQTVIRSFSEFSGTNIVAGPEVEGKVTAHIRDVPWRQAMDMILKSHGFGYREEYGMIRVSTLEKLTKEELEVQAAERKKDDLLPLETRIVPLSFAKASEVREALKDVLTQRGSIQVQPGVNALVVNDIAKNVEKVAAMVAQLDRKTRQVEIVAKLVDVDFDATREMGVRWDLLNLASKDVNAVGDFALDARSASPVGTFRVGTVQSWGEVQAIIDMLEKENKANIISNPRIVTAENREASIMVGKEIPLIVADEAGNPITELTKIGIILRVTPHVNLDNTITLDLHPEVSDLAAQATVQGGVVIVMSEADTRVVVGNGETAVIGGLINEAQSRLENGIPILKDVPVFGRLFKLTSENKKKRELIIFVTPKIVEA